MISVSLKAMQEYILQIASEHYIIVFLL